MIRVVLSNLGWAMVLGTILLSNGCEKTQLAKTSTCDETITTQHPRSEAFQTILDNYTDKGLPGITLLVRDSSGLWQGSAGMADIEKDVQMKPCHVSKVASITKPFMATLTLKLESEGVLRLEDKVGKYVEADKLDGIENAEEATIRQLLNHTSGVYDVVSDEDFYLAVLNHPQKEWDAEALLAYVEGRSSYFKPGKDVRYSNTNYLLLSMVIEGATGQSHFRLLKNKIIDPLGLNNTFYHPQQSLPSHTAQGYFDLYNNGNLVDLTNYNTGNGNGYNGVYASVKDLQVFIDALLKHETLLADEQLAKMKEFNAVDSFRALGAGLIKDFRDHPSGQYGMGHSGRDLAYSGEMYYFPEKDFTMVTLVNFGTNGESGLANTYFNYRDAVVDTLLP